MRGLERHHQRLADRIDRRVRDLREQLVEVGEQVRRAIADSTASGVSVPIEPIGSLPVSAIGVDDQLDVLVGVAERALLREQLVALDRAAAASASSSSSQLEDVLVEPLAVREAAGDVALELRVVDDAALDGVDDEHHAGRQAALLRAPARAGTSITPVSDARITRSSVVIVQRAGRRPLRSSVAPTSWPSENTIAAGPSHGSTSDDA